MCNAKYLAVAAIAVAAVYTGGAALGALGATGTAAAGGAAAAGTAGAAAAGTAGAATAGAATAGSMTALQTAGLYSSIAGTAMSAYGQYQQAQASKDAANYNAKVAELQRQDALDRGQADQEALGRKIGGLRGQQTANMAANGLDLSSGTPAAVLAQTDYYGLEDQRTVANNASREAAGYGYRGAMARATSDSIDPGTAAGASLLTNSGNVADRWYKYKG